MKLTSTEAQILKSEINAIAESMKHYEFLEFDDCNIELYDALIIGGTIPTIRINILPKGLRTIA